MEKDIEFVRSIGFGEVFAESASEYVMPDYEPDVRKILFSEAEVRPAGKFIGENEAEFNGIVVYNVIYSDAEGKISGVSFNSDYRLVVKCPGISIENVLIEPRVTNFALRLLSPRKLSAKCSVSASVRVNERQRLCPNGDAFEEKGKEEKRKSVMIRESQCSEMLEREFAEELKRLDGAIEDEVKVIYAKATPITEFSEICDTGAHIKGEIRLCALIVNGDAPVNLVERNIVLDEIVPFEGIDAETKLIPEILVTSEKAPVKADEDGCTVVFSVIAELTARGEKNVVAKMLTDAYLTDYPTDNKYSDYRYTELFDVVSINERHTAQIPRSEIEEGIIREIPFVKAEPRIESVRLEEKNIVVSMEMRYLGIASEANDDGSISYSPIKHTANYTVSVKNSCQDAEKMTAEVRVNSCTADANMDAKTIYLSAPVNISLILSKENSERLLTECFVRRAEKYEDNGALVTVYYPEAEESLFDVAKRFHVSIERIEECNAGTVSAISDGMSADVKRIIIY